MFKKLAALAGAGALLLSAAVPAFAYWDYAYVNNSAVAISDTGMNSQGNDATANGLYNSAVAGSGGGDRWMSTGPATSYARALVVANTHIGCGVCGDDYYWHMDEAYVDNSAMAGAYTGGNSQGNSAQAIGYGNGATAGSGSGDRGMTTGGASSTARAWTIVNTHWGR